MGRWRPPLPKSSPYITAEGYKILEEKLKGLWEHRKDVTRALAAAAAEGDRSENAEYIYRKKELRELNNRIRYLQNRMPKLKIVKEINDQNRILFGAWVTLGTGDGRKVTYRIVGPDEFDSNNAFISIDSPLARALLGKVVDDEVVIKIKQEEQRYCVIDISYTIS
jgi:transcription elongation factor GreB